MKISLSWQRFVVCTSTALVIALGAALAPGAQASDAFKSCANKQITFQVGEEGEKKTTVSVPVKQVEVKGTSCAAAYEFFHLAFSGENGGSTGYPQGYRCKPATFKAPLGYFPQICTKPGKTIKYAQPGG
jgi:hypothetical protein